jgi:hypothetical protein
MAHHIIVLHLSHEAKIWLDFWKITRDPRALVMAQVASLVALHKPDPPPPTEIDGADSP